MPHYLVDVFVFVIAILFIILVHELGHFFTARIFKIKVKRLSIGFGPALWSWRDKRDIEYVLTYFPLGGYVKMLDEREGTVTEADLPYAFNRQAFWKRLLVVFAGPLANFVFAIFIYWFIFAVGLTLPKPIIGDVLPNSIAAKAGLEANSQIKKIDNTVTRNWQDVLFVLFPFYGENSKISFQVVNSKNITQTFALDLGDWHISSLKPQLLESLGIQAWQPLIIPKIVSINSNSPAALAGLKAGDLIISVNGKSIDSFSQWVQLLKKSPRAVQHVTVMRQGHIEEISFTPMIRTTWSGKQYLNLGFSLPKPIWPRDSFFTAKYNVVSSGFQAVQMVWLYTNFNLEILGKLMTGDLSFKVLTGPISLVKSMEYASAQGFIAFLMLMALVSVSIGIINLIPIPGLDGGQALIILIETIMHRRLSVGWQVLLYRLGMIIIFILIAQAIANDILRIN